VIEADPSLRFGMTTFYVLQRREDVGRRWIFGGVTGTVENEWIVLRAAWP
jgi:hypothetical protein